MFVDGELKLNEGGRSGGGGVKFKGRQPAVRCYEVVL